MKLRWPFMLRRTYESDIEFVIGRLIALHNRNKELEAQLGEKNGTVRS